MRRAVPLWAQELATEPLKHLALEKTTKIIHIDIDPAEIGKNIGADLPLVGDAKLVLANDDLQSL